MTGNQNNNSLKNKTQPVSSLTLEDPQEMDRRFEEEALKHQKQGHKSPTSLILISFGGLAVSR